MLSRESQHHVLWRFSAHGRSVDKTLKSDAGQQQRVDQVDVNGILPVPSGLGLSLPAPFTQLL